jgi:putative SOS response-associated peptidase YedK
MPVILEPERFEAWLTGAAGLELLKPAANDVLQLLAGIAPSEQLACSR